MYNPAPGHLSARNTTLKTTYVLHHPHSDIPTDRCRLHFLRNTQSSAHSTTDRSWFGTVPLRYQDSGFRPMVLPGIGDVSSDHPREVSWLDSL